MTVTRVQVRVERPPLADGDQRADPPDQRREREHAEQRQEERVQQEAEELAHAADGTLTPVFTVTAVFMLRSTERSA